MDNAVLFSKKFENVVREEADGKSFQREFIELFGVKDAREVGIFEYRVSKDDSQKGYIDYLWPGKIAIEMKSAGKDLKKAYAQLKEYVVHLNADEMPSLMMVCDFKNIQLYSRTTDKQVKFKTKDLHKYVKHFSSIAGYEPTRVYDAQEEVNIKASEKMAKLHTAMDNVGYKGHDLQVYLVRLLFCLFADDTGIFPPNAFLNYIENTKEDGSDLDARLDKLFQVLNMSPEVRKTKSLLTPDLLQFRYVNGGLFANRLSSADFNAKMRQTLIEACQFDWHKISPAIFGAMFQGVMNKKERHDLGAHYTSEENILKVINPLFMDDLWKEFEEVKTTPILLDAFHKKIASLKFLDPACGCGNFLIIAYRELRNLEYEILRMKKKSNQLLIDPTLLLKVNVGQFYGIEIEDFPCQVAQVSMWLVDHLMNMRMKEEFGLPYIRLPLSQSAKIVQGNALTMNWDVVVPASELSYILGNPPFLGFSEMKSSQKEDVAALFGDQKNVDYVSCWYKKSLQYIKNYKIDCAFVSTNSICQGEMVHALWPKLFAENISLNFAYRTFKWSNEAKGKAAVHCIILGFSNYVKEVKKIYGEKCKVVENISPYLIDHKDTIVYAQRKPFGKDTPKMIYGNKPADGGNLIIEEKDYDDFIAKEPDAIKWIRRYVGASEFLHNKKRYCLWLKNISPAELKKMPLVMKRVKACKETRENSIAEGIRKFAETPTLFAQCTQVEGEKYIIVPRHSSESRKYIPIDYVEPEVIASDAVFTIPNASLYHFGILTSCVHNIWMRITCGRIKSDFRYSKEMVYNAFPWIDDVPIAQRKKIATLAQAVLDERKKHSDSSLADLYDPDAMPVELKKAHNELDKEILKLYGYSKKNSEEAIVADLLNRYEELLKKGNIKQESKEKTSRKKNA
ncbi:MAG: class I SAM-dependent DNA methyltransferase [Mailhella sp.]|nr:class I SAM-dependent DNA methyltransferase [Mailhella sp.]